MMDSPPSVGYVEDDDFDLRGDLIEALNNAKTAATPVDKLQFLTEAREIVLHRDQTKELLKSFAKEFAEFHTEKKANVRYFVINFIEEACKDCKEVIPDLFGSLVFLLNDKNKKNQNKVWVTVMNLFRPALSLLCDPTFFETNQKETKALCGELEVIRTAALKVFSDKKNKIMPIIDVLKTISLSFLMPDNEVIKINSEQKERGPTEARADTGPDSFSLAMIPRTHPELSVVNLEKHGSDIVTKMCEELSSIAKEKDSMSADSSVKSVPLSNALQILALHRSSVREQVLGSMLDAAYQMEMEDEKEETSHNKLRFVQNLRTNFLEFLKVKWHQHLKEWRNKVFDALCLIGARDQAEKAMKQLEEREKMAERKEQKRQVKEAEQMRKRQRMEESSHSGHKFVEALDAEEMRKFDYPPRRMEMSESSRNTLLNLGPQEIADVVVAFMDHLPGPPPRSSIQKKESDCIRTFAQFVTYIDREVSSKSATSASTENAASQAATKFKLSETVEWRKDALIRMLEQHEENVNKTALRLFTGSGVELPSNGDAMIARVACDFVQRSNGEGDLRPFLVDFIAKDLQSRFGLALSTLFHLFAYSEPKQQDNSGIAYMQYDDIFLRMLEALLEMEQQKEKENSPRVNILFREKTFVKLFTDTPRLPVQVFPLLAQFCETKGKHMFGILTLRDLFLYRPSTRTTALEILLFFAVCDKSWAREQAIRCIANQVYPQLTGVWKEKAESFARGMLESAISISRGDLEDSPDVAVKNSIEKSKADLLENRKESILHSIITLAIQPDGESSTTLAVAEKEGKTESSENREGEKMEDEDGGDLGEGQGGDFYEQSNFDYDNQEPFTQMETGKTNEDQEMDLTRRIQLYVALSRRNQALLKGYMETYAQVDKVAVRKVLDDAVTLLLQLLGKELGPSQALALFQGYPAGATQLLIHALTILANERICDSREKRQSLVSQAKAMQGDDELHLFEMDDNFVIPVLGSLTRSEIRRYLISILGMEQDSVRAAINSIIAGARFAHQVTGHEEEEEEDLDSQPFLPLDLMVTLVNMPISDELTTENIIDATEICFQRKDIFTKDVLEGAITEMLMQDELPKLTLRIMMRSIDQQPQTKQSIAEALQELVDRQIWNLEDNDIWTGFVVCAIKLSTPGYPILFRLPLPQLSSAFEICKKTGGAAVLAKLLYFARQNQAALNLPADVLELLDTYSGSDSQPSKKQKVG